MTNTEQIAAMAERIEKLENGLRIINRRLSDGTMTFDELIRETVFCCGIARALLPSGGMRVNDLEPCPFCGGTDIDPEELGYNGLGHHVCRDCHASGPTAEKTHANSAKAWNKRALLSSGDQG